MSTGISREDALLLLKQYIKNERTLWHSLSSEAVLKALAKRLNEDAEKWAMAGLLHDLDVEITDQSEKLGGINKNFNLA